MKEITPEDIRQKYTEDLIERLLIPSIKTINERLQERGKAIVEQGYIRIGIKGLGWEESVEKDILYKLIKQFFTSWSVILDSGLGENYYLRICPPEPLCDKITVDIDSIKDNDNTEANPDDVVENRTDILDIR